VALVTLAYLTSALAKQKKTDFRPREDQDLMELMSVATPVWENERISNIT